MNSYVKSGMTLTLSNWGSDFDTMSWLDKNTGCTGTCGSPDFTISNIKYSDNFINYIKIFQINQFLI